MPHRPELWPEVDRLDDLLRAAEDAAAAKAQAAREAAAAAKAERERCQRIADEREEVLAEALGKGGGQQRLPGLTPEVA